MGVQSLVNRIGCTCKQRLSCVLCSANNAAVMLLVELVRRVYRMDRVEMMSQAWRHVGGAAGAQLLTVRSVHFLLVPAEVQSGEK